MGMTKEQFSVIVKGMKAVYVNEKFIPDKNSFDVWFALLQDLDYKTCTMAVQRWMQTSRWMPTVADIREMALNNTTESVDSGQAWEMARDSVRRYGMMRKEEALAGLPTDVAEAVNRFGWRDLCDMEADEVMASRAQFLRIYQQIADRNKQTSQMSPNLKAMIAKHNQEVLGCAQEETNGKAIGMQQQEK